jgi:MHS family proline/betaine transporter-like MFS transporter
MHYKLYRTSIFATIIGNCMEWFDYALIGYVAPRYLDIYPQEKAAINPLFFIYAVALIGRPLGGIVFGYLGDLLGRRLILILSITLMATGALFTALLPSLFSFSLLTPMLLLLILLVHNLSAGGETPATVAYLYETFPIRLRSFALSWVNFGFFLGVFLSTLDFSALFWELKEQQFLDWGWRLPFFFSAFLGFLGLSFRKKLHETPQFSYAKLHHHLLKNPLKSLFQNYKKEFFLGAGMLCLHSIAINTLVIFGPSYFQTYLKRTPDETLTLSIFSMMVAMLATSLAGYLSLKISTYKLLKSLAFLLIILTLPIYILLQSASIVPLFVANGLLAILISMFSALIPIFVCDLFPANLRCIGYSSCRNLPIPLIDGAVPLLLSWLITSKGLLLAPAYAIIIGAVISVVSMFMIRHREPHLEEAST